MIWETSPSMTLGNVALRIIKAAIPVVMLWVGKLIIDEIILQIDAQAPSYSLLFIYIAMEFGLAIASDIINRGITLLDGQLGDLLVIKHRSSSYTMPPHSTCTSLKTAYFMIN